MAFTTSRPTLESVIDDLTGLGLTHLEVEEIFKKTRDTLLTPEVQTKAAEQGVSNVKKTFPVKSQSETGPNCGHGVPMVKRESRGKFWWACNAKDPKGTFYWKNGEGCEWVQA